MTTPVNDFPTVAECSVFRPELKIDANFSFGAHPGRGAAPTISKRSQNVLVTTCRQPTPTTNSLAARRQKGMLPFAATIRRAPAARCHIADNALARRARCRL